jgi:hypothetical protein
MLAGHIRTLFARSWPLPGAERGEQLGGSGHSGNRKLRMVNIKLDKDTLNFVESIVSCFASNCCLYHLATNL